MALKRIVWAILIALSLHTASFAVDNVKPLYFVVFLRPDPGRKPLAKADGERIQAAHMANIHKMAQDGILIAAGPFEDTPTTISGIFVFETNSLATAQKIASQDPTVIEHRNTVDVHAWQGPAAIGDEYRRLHALDPKTPEKMQVHPLCMIFHGAKWNASASMQEHEQYVAQLRSQGKLGAAGPIENSDDFVSLVIFKAIPDDEARKLMESDPAVKAGALRVEYHRWWSSDHVLPW